MKTPRCSWFRARLLLSALLGLPLVSGIASTTTTVPSDTQLVNAGGIESGFTVTNHTTNKPIHLADFAGKVVVLDYFTYWCGWCALDSPLTETDIQQYYAARGGNAAGVPVQVLSISIDQTNPAATTSFITKAGVELAADDTWGEAWAQNDYTNQIPTYVVINGVPNALGMTQWQVLYTSVGYPGAGPIRQAIDSVALPPKPVIGTQPTAATATAGGKVTFKVAASATPAATYQWQSSTDGGSTWKNVPAGSPYSGQTTGTLTIAGATASMSGTLYRCVATSNGESATSSSARLTVNKASQTISFPAPTNKTYGAAAFAVSATATSGLPVSLMIESGPATFSGGKVVITGAGTVVLSANQAGNATFLAAPQVSRSFNVAKAAQTISFPSIANKANGAAPFVVSATATSGLPVTFAVASGPARISGKTVTLTGAGTVTIRASQAGNANYSAAVAVSRSFTVAAKP
jgi:thiol-disulfide isomerase/thioredoxin